MHSSLVLCGTQDAAPVCGQGRRSACAGRPAPGWASAGRSGWRIAALILLAACAYLFIERKPSVHSNETAHIQRDFSDLASFYDQQIIEKINLIKDFDEGESEQFTQDFQKLDAMYQVLIEEMKVHPSEKVKDALVLNLLVRIDLLNQQLKKLEDSKRRSTLSSSV